MPAPTLEDARELFASPRFSLTEERWSTRDGRVSRPVIHHPGAVAVLAQPDPGSVLLVRQFRYPAYVNGHDDLMIEAVAGLLDDETPEVRIRAETEEETGYRLHDIRKVFEAFMSPGAVTEKLHFFVAEYEPHMRMGDGGGLPSEGEDIEVLELPIDQALAMIGDGRIGDAKTIMLLQYAALHIFR